jgi:hypothetical protein
MSDPRTVLACVCGHDMYEHYMTEIKVGYCFQGCGCKEFSRDP